MNNFGEFLYSLRKEKGLTQAELAAALGVTNKAVSKWETGEAMPETGLLIPISRIFDVTVDELLAGKRAEGKTRVEKEIDGERGGDDEDEDNDEAFDPDKHLFTKGKDDKPKSFLEIISGVVCATVLLAGVAAYLIIGGLFETWHPYWVIIPCCAMLCGIIGIIFDLCDEGKRHRKIAKGENPYIGAICGILMLTCIAVYLLLGALIGLWHPCWIIVAGGAVVSGILGSFGTLYSNKRK